jgi:predicted nucleic acid-binding Zn ribbon protein
MNRGRHDFDDDEEDDFDDASWDADDAEDDADGDVLTCPYCGAAIYDDAVQCPQCGEYLSRTERPTVNQPAWVVITAAILLAGLLFAILR